MTLKTEKVVEFFEQYDPNTEVVFVTPTFGEEVARLKVESDNTQTRFHLCAELIEFTEEDVTYKVEDVLGKLADMTTEEFFFGQLSDFGGNVVQAMPMELISKAYEDNRLFLVVDYI